MRAAVDFSLARFASAFLSAPRVSPSALVSWFSSILSSGRVWHRHIPMRAGSGGTACYRQLGRSTCSLVPRNADSVHLLVLGSSHGVTLTSPSCWLRLQAFLLCGFRHHISLPAS